MGMEKETAALKGDNIPQGTAGLRTKKAAVYFCHDLKTGSTLILFLHVAICRSPAGPE